MKKTNYSTIFKVVEPKRKFLIFLILIIAVSVIFESIGFAMLIPFFEVFLDSQSGSLMSDFIRKGFSLFGLEPNVTSICVLFFTMMLFKNFLISLRETLKSKLSYEFQRDWRDLIFKKYLSMPFREFSKKKHGDLSNLLINETIRGTSGILQLIDFFTGIVTIPIFLLVLLISDPKLTVIGLSFASILAFFVKGYLNQRGKKVGDKELLLRQEISEQVIENIGAMRHIRTFNIEKSLTKTLYEKNNTLKNLIYTWDGFTASVSPVIETFLVLGVVSYLYYAVSVHGIDHFKKLLPIVSMMVVVAHKTLGRVSRLMVNRMVIAQYSPAFENILKNIYDQDREWPPSDQGGSFDGVKQKVELKNLSFSYDRKKVLSNIDMVFKRGEITAIIGGSGSGKSTIADILLRLYQVKEGEILIDDVNLETYSTSSWRERIGFVSQDNFLFHESIEKNILVGAPEADLEDVMEAAKKAGAHDFIMNNLEDGYNTIVGDRGSRISGGQRQRIALARALIRKPDVLILDEATSALDIETELKINEEIANNIKDTIIIVITHRDSILKYASKTYSLDSGRLI